MKSSNEEANTVLLSSSSLLENSLFSQSVKGKRGISQRDSHILSLEKINHPNVMTVVRKSTLV